MKNLIYLLIASMVVISCNCSESDKNKNNTHKESSGNLYEDDNLIVQNLENWSGKKGPNDIGFYTWDIQSSGDIYKDLEDQYSEIDEVHEKTEVDGLPALTQLKQYQQNETIKERVWLIWNGKSVIQFSVAAPLNKNDDKEAWKVRVKVKIKPREDDVSLPDPKRLLADKPDYFPHKATELFANHWGSQIILSDSAIQNALQFNTYLNQISAGTVEVAFKLDKNNRELLDSLATTFYLNDWTHFERIVMACGAAVDP